MFKLVKTRIPFYWTLLLCAVIAAISYVWFRPAPSLEQDVQTSNTTPALTESFEVKRLQGYNYIRPLMFVNTLNKAPKYSAFTQKIAAYIENKKAAGDIASASFYFHDVEKSLWTGYNEDEQYNPGSLMKVPELISILRLEEEKPGTLNKQLYYPSPFVTEKRTRFVSNQMQPGKSYSVRELLRRMIAYSDNNATVLLDQNLDQRIFNETLTNLGLPLPQKGATNYPVSAKGFSLFMRAIHNAAYLTIPHSEYAAELLTTTDFKEGFAKSFPPGGKLIHKFGEAGTMEEPQLHESCIVYVNNKAYVLTVMTRGRDMSKLSNCLSDIASMTYQELAAGK